MIFDLVVTEPVAGVAVISIVGELDLSTAPRLREELIRLTMTDSPRVVLDLGGVDLLDPTGLGVIFDGVKRTRSRGGELVLARAEPQVRQDLEITRVIEILPVFETVEDATAFLTGL